MDSPSPGTPTQHALPAQNPPGARPLLRLNRFLAGCGLGSRRRCDELIAAGRIMVNGRRVEQLGTKIDPERDRVEFGSRNLEPVRRLEYIAFHKPRDCIVTRFDPEQRATIYDVIKQQGFDADHLRYAGRLDWDSEGLLILTNDGDLIHALTHPRFKIKKVYLVRADRRLEKRDAEAMVREGVESEGQVLRAGSVRAAEAMPASRGREYWYEVVLYEGKNRQIRRMFEGLGYDVVRLKRVQFGSVRLGDLSRAGTRPLTEREIAGLRNAGYR